MNRKLDDRYVKSITPPAAGQEMHMDDLLPNFGLRVSAGGAMTWVVQRRVYGKPRRFKLGRYPVMGLAVARDEARRIHGLIDAGKDPDIEAERAQEEQRRQAEDLRRHKGSTFAAVRDRFMAEHVDGFKADGKTPRLRKHSRYAYRLMLCGKWFKEWEPRPLNEITRGDVLEILERIHRKQGGYTANRVLAQVRKMMNWATSKDLIATAPTVGVEPPAEEEARERVLHERELFHLWSAFQAAPVFAPVLKLLMVTGQRREEVAGLRRPELENMEGAAPLWRIPKQRAKNNREHLVPLPPLAVALLAEGAASGGLLFTTTGSTPISGFSKAKDNINRALAERRKQTPDTALDSLLKDWRVHDIRRTAATGLAEIGTSRDVVEKILNHVSGTRAGIAGTYNRSELADERRIAIELWAKYLQRVTAERMDDRAIAALRAELRAEHRRRLTGELRPLLQVVERQAA